ncbi:MAG: PqqD family peptide modification chaperone [Bacteroidaceae bacterium]|nr:PqqD family peptide modification chaperone [Bacteroidales bacterium]MBP3408836.1 PqqD family peptide modification chaperone [Bacteroidaceae bacterium]MBQ8694793.1 PqqD family peptide modification chaperone [Bacteroidaceae bacterium]
MKAKKGFELQNVCGEYIIVPAGIENVDFSRIISLNPTAAFLWEKVSSLEEFTIETLVEALLEEYEVEEAVAREDCALIIERWAEMELIEQ